MSPQFLFVCSCAWGIIIRDKTETVARNNCFRSLAPRRIPLDLAPLVPRLAGYRYATRAQLNLLGGDSEFPSNVFMSSFRFVYSREKSLPLLKKGRNQQAKYGYRVSHVIRERCTVCKDGVHCTAARVEAMLFQQLSKFTCEVGRGNTLQCFKERRATEYASVHV